MTTTNGTRAAMLAPSKVTGYRPSILGRGFGGMAWGGEDAWYTPAEGRYMLRDAQIQFTLGIKLAPLASIKWSVEAEDKEAGEMAARAFERFWTRHLAQAFQCVPWGWMAAELEYGQDDSGDITFEGLADVYPLDATPLLSRSRRGVFGFSLRNNTPPDEGQRGKDGAGVNARGDHYNWVRPPRSLWITYRGLHGNHHGQGVLQTMWRPWKAKTSKNGARDVVDRWYFLNSYDGRVMRHPEGEVETSAGQFMSAYDYARQVVETWDAGGVAAFPGTADEKGNYAWTYERSTANGEPGGLIEWLASFDTEILKAGDVPPEVVAAMTSGSGWSGRSVPFLVFLAGEDMIADSIAQAAWSQMVRPLVAANRGGRAALGCKLKLKSLVEMAEEAESKKGGGGGGPKPPPPGQPANEEGGVKQGPPQAPRPPGPVRMSFDDDSGEEIELTHEEFVRLANDAVKRAVGDRWQGPSGRWFTKRDDGRVVPAKAPGGAEGGAKKGEGGEGKPAPARPEKKPKATVDDVHGRIEEKRAAGEMSAKDMHELAGELLELTVAQLDELKKRLGVRAGGAKYEKASKIAAAALKNADTKRNKEKTDGGRRRPADGAGGERTGGPDAGAGRPVEGPAGPAGGAGADQERGAESGPAGRTTAERVPASAEEVSRRLDRFEKFFEAKGQGHVAGWMRTLKDHVNAVGGEAALASLAQSASGGQEGDVQYWGVGTEEANWRNMGHFMEAYLARNGITAVTGDTSSPDAPLVSALGAPDRYVAGDFRPEGMHFKDKLSEAKTLPGLETSEDISKVMGRPVTHLTDEVTARLDEKYGPGQWIVKCYDDNAAAGYGIFFPQRAAAIAQDARNAIWDAGVALSRYGFELRRDGAGKVVGLKHSGGDVYDFGTEKYEKTIGGDARHWADRAANAAHHEKGAMLPEGSFMAQPAFKAVGISDAERAAGKTWHEKNEGRVHLVTRPDGTVEVIPHSTWLKGGSLPVVFEDDDTRAMARAAKEAIEKVPHEARKGQVYAPDVMKTADGYRVVELNAQGDNNGSGYLHDNHFTIDAYTSYLTGRAPAHVAFIRQLLTRRKRGGDDAARMSTDGRHAPKGGAREGVTPWTLT